MGIRIDKLGKKEIQVGEVIVIKRTSIQSKLLISMNMIGIIGVAIVGVITYQFTMKESEKRATEELNTLVQLTYEKIESSTDAAIKNYLRAIAEKNTDLTQHFYNEYKLGHITEEVAKAKATEIILSQRIGESGYIYCVNSKGIIQVHPKAELIQTDLSEYSFMKTQKTLKRGYIEYLWKNPDEAKERPKALYMDYFEPWDWIISTSSYRSEFNKLVNIKDYSEDILSVKIGKTGYMYVLDLNGVLVTHPFSEGENIIDSKDEKGNYFVREISAKKNGQIIYPWKNVGEKVPKDKMVIYKYLEEIGYIVAAGIYIDELYYEVYRLGYVIIFTTIMAALFAFILSMRLSKSFTNPIIELKLASEEILSGNYGARSEVVSNDEIGDLAHAFNNMVIQIERNYDEIVNQKIKIEGYSKNLELMVEDRTKELNEIKEKAEAATLAKSDFLANMSHEIRTPINAIMGFSELALRTQMNFKQKDYISKIDLSAKTLLGVINDILDFSKIEAGKLKMEQINFNLQDVLTGLIDMISVMTNEKGLNLYSKIAADVPLELVGDPLRVGQVLINLVNNAVKFTEKGQISVMVGLHTLQDDSCMLQFIVKDTGIGISKDHIDNLFLAFSQADTSVTRKYGGTGLGLSISKHLVGLMNGNIEVASVEGKGSTFVFTAKFSRQMDHAEVECEQRRAVAKDISFEGKRLLLAEDNKLNQQIALEVLSSVGFEVTIACNGQVAIEMALTEHYDLILMDVQMPVIGGYEATRLIREKEIGVHVPIIAMTAHAMQGTREECLSAGMDDYISKPIDMNKMLQVLSMWVQGDEKIEPASEGAKNIKTHDRTVAFVEKAPLQSVQNHDLMFIMSLDMLDYLDGLERMNLDASFYRELLQDFVNDYAPYGDEMILDLKNNNQAKMKSNLHLINGVSGNLSMRDVHKIAKTLEIKLIKEPDMPEIEIEKVLIMLKNAIDVVSMAVSGTLQNK